MTEQTKSAVGQALANAREAKGMTVADVADKLKLTSRQVEAIESGDFARLPGAVFARGFVRNYARLVEVPAEDLLAQLNPSATATETTTITAPSAGVRFSTSPMHRWLLLPLAGLALFLLLVVALYLWLSRGEEAYLPTTTQGSLPAEPIMPVVPSEAPVVLAPEVQSAAPAQPPVSPEAAAAVAPTQASTPATTNSATAPPSGASLLLVAREAAWIEVVSGDDKRFKKLLQPGERLSVRGNPPFSLVVGNAANVQLSYKNRSIDLKPFTGETVARLTLE